MAIALVAAPLLARSRETLDFSNYLWLAWVAGKGTVAAGHPVLFTNTGADGPFYPLFAFYGATLFVIAGVLGQLFAGQILAVYIAIWVLAIAAAYLGTLSLARQLGVRGLLAHAPALCVLTSAYYITDIYARADWPELVAVSAVPPLLASTLHLIRAPRWRPLPVLVFAVSAVILTGSHNITLVWTVTVAAMALIILGLLGAVPWRLPYRRIAGVVGLAVAALCVNGWFLVTDLVHARDVGLGNYTTTQTGYNAIFDSLGVLLNPFRSTPSFLFSTGTASPGFYVDAPIWFLAWGVIAGAVVLWRWPQARRDWRFYVAPLILVAALIALIANPYWPHFPFPWDEIQFPYRINSYLVFAIAAAVLVACLLVQRASRAQARQRTIVVLKASLAVVVAISVALCVWQEWVPNLNVPLFVRPSAELVSVHSLPGSWHALTDYADTSAPIVPVAAGRIMWIPWTRVQGDYFSGSVAAPPGPAPIETNILGGDYVVRISGVKLLGRASTGQAVVARLSGGGGSVHVVIQTAGSRAIVLGRILSIGGLAVLAAVLGCTAIRARRRRVPRPAAAGEA
jgi:hypothetical protein